MKSLFAVTLIFGFLTLGFCQNVLYCWVGYANNGNLRGGPIPCDGGTCLHVNGTYSGQQLDLFACEPLGLCSSTGHISVAGLDGYCCTSGDNCNANGFTMPVQTTPTPGLPTPIICNEGIYMNNVPLTNTTIVKKVCYGNCASVTGSLGANNFTVATCDPLTLCDNLDLVNSCHVMPQKVISGCCCNSTLCIDPANNLQPTPPPPPPNSIKCFIGLQRDAQTPIGSEVYCPGMCHSTSATINNSKYTVFACDRYQVCEMFGIRPNECGSEEGALQSCCCNTDNCNTPNGFTPPTVDPNPPNQAERCFTGFQTTNLGPLGRSMECFGDCVTYSAGGLKIFGCDPISVCEQLGAKNGTGTYGDLSISCCPTSNCNYKPSTTTTSCYNGITINMPEHNVSYSKAQSLPCIGKCATFSVTYRHLNVDVYTCDPYNVCNIDSSDILKVNCCDQPNCNFNPAIPVTTVAPMGRNISCFQGFQIRRGFAFGNQMTCDGACARVHIGQDTIYTCDPGDTCGDFGVDGCNMLFDGLTVCCCKGQMCNAPEAQIQPAIKQNLNCFIGYGVGAAVSGGQLPCNGMCGKLTTTLNNVTVDAYLCLDLPICTERDAYERCGHVMTDRAVKVCCCGGYDHCNYEPLNGTVLPPPPESRTVSCPQGLYINGRAVYHTGTTITTCPNDCGLLSFNTTFGQQVINFAYYGCDPTTFCSQYSLQNSCGALGSSVSGCCCNSDLCMNPIVGRMTPAQNTTGAPNLYCWVGYANNGNLRGGPIPCDGGTCVHVNGSYSGQQVDIFACEPMGLCSSTGHISVAGLDGYCCNNTNNCNANGFVIPVQPTPTPALPSPIVCNEGIYMNSLAISTPVKKLCYGNCASITGSLGNNTFTVATCDPLTLCDNLGLNNSCHVMPQQVLSGCCCNSNLCIDPASNVIPSLPPVILNCWVGYAYNNTLRGAPIPCDGGTCLHVNGSYAGQQVDIFACEPLGLCNKTTGHLTVAGLDGYCCNGADNCNANGFSMPVQPTPTQGLPSPIICNEGLYMNNMALSTPVKKLCYGNCASVTGVHGSSNFTVATCDPLTLCDNLGLNNNCHVMPQKILSGCCCNSNLCIDPANNVIPSATPPPATALNCWVGYANNGNLRGAPIPCDGGSCLHVNGSYAGQQVDIFACEPLNLCNKTTGHLTVAGLDGYCCTSGDNCNAIGFTIPVQPTPTQGLPPPIVCNAGLYMNNIALSTPVKKLCYGNCASVTGVLGSSNFTVATCDPLTLCDNLDLVNSCHVMPQKVISGCCCNSNLCIDPANNLQPTPPPPPPNSIKCFIGLQQDSQTPVGSETYCPGMCHSTSAMIGKSNYTVFACDRYQVCEMFGIAPNQCGSEEGALQSCCCDSDNCNTPKGFTPPTVDPNPPGQAERCFTGFQTTNLGPLGRSMECLGDCVTYSAGGLKIFGCDPISVCEQLGAKNGTVKFGDLNVTCCSTRDCNYQAVTTVTSCYNGITINMPEHNVSYSKAQSLPCKGRCATFSVAYKHLNVDVYTCDPYNVCNLNSSDILKVNCCDSPNCNLNNNTIPVTTVAPSNTSISCFQGFQIGFGFPFGNQMTCDGACARVHIGQDTIYTCDPGDTCGDFGVDGCNMLFEGLTVCCCKGDRCNDARRQIQPAIKQNLNCFVGYSIGGFVSGGQLPCNGMCGKLTTSINSTDVNAYLCLDLPICTERNAYERCGYVQTDMAVKVCCCGGYDHCNYEPMNSTVLPPPAVDNNVTCPQGLYVNGKNLYNTGNTVVTCPNSCGLMQFNTTFMNQTVSFGYYGCDPKTLCDDFNADNSCGAMNSISGCCCNSDMCMNPLVGRMIPGGGPSPTQGTGTTTTASATSNTLSAILLLTLSLLFL